ncbi:MAG: F0F1 ATP synthase subunit B [Bacillota bacterium]|uniref:ATP synthase subunit b n=2 Tax=Carboxydocella TaxID=178898 RepID=A0A1T4RGP7_9FIRM|nr:MULTISPECIES: F0F1 ATP synthase subunit B [Carboxydocella]AVX19546.1 ATP synthase F0 subcomplex B subunit [Carboxydocella thermautotrophica]AVX29963.1 ATP synthase F0 subcomplex B subunit [Carboxydocella thermautotrophica]GAW31403.1 ATP synthase F0 subunit B [Carboxydocella sp. JDF658]SKA15079.1 ATP synthase F0 subcomplex B subunit [Carboxydocella sporoproducens DSM 16521]
MEFNLSTFVWSFINFFVLLAILNKLLYKPMLQMLEERKKTISESMQQAEQARAEAERIKQEYAEQLAQAKKESQEIIARAERMGEEMREELVRNARAEADKALKAAQEEIAREKAKAVAQLRAEVANLAVLAAGKVVGKSITVEDHEKMVKEFIDEVGDLPC